MRTYLVICLFILAGCSSSSESVMPNPSDVTVEVEGQNASIPNQGRIEIIEIADGRVCRTLDERAISAPDGRRVTHVCGGRDASDAEEAIVAGLRLNGARQWVTDVIPMKVGSEGFEFGKIETHLAGVGAIRLGNGVLCSRLEDDVMLAVGGQAVSYSCERSGDSTLVLAGDLVTIDGRLAMLLVEMISAGDAHEVRESKMIDLGESRAFEEPRGRE